MALGATGQSVLRLMLGSTLLGGAVGVVIGIGGSALTGRALAPFLFRVNAIDPLTYVTIVALLGVVSVVVTWIPARRATRVEPVRILRAE